jgi:hypothetical protein
MARARPQSVIGDTKLIREFSLDTDVMALAIEDTRQS